jgi:uncharacterized protein
MKQPKWVLYRDKKSEWRWRFVSSNGRTLADSAESYKRIGGATKAIMSLRTTITAEIEIKQ